MQSTDYSLIFWMQAFKGAQAVEHTVDLRVLRRLPAVQPREVSLKLVDRLPLGTLDELGVQRGDLLLLLDRLLAALHPFRRDRKCRVTLFMFRVFLQLWGPLDECVQNVVRTLLPKDEPAVTWFNFTKDENEILTAMRNQPVGTFVVSVAEAQPPWPGNDRLGGGRFAFTFVSEEEGEPRDVKRGYFTRTRDGIRTGSKRVYPTLREAVAAFGAYCTTPLRL